jgi:hypothetical protein
MTARDAPQGRGRGQRLQHDTAGLSRLQRRMLRQLQGWTDEIRASGDIRAGVIMEVWGMPWRPGAGYADWTPATRAAYSRILRRLEQRGLVRRVRYGRTQMSRRTTHVRILPQANTWWGG